MRKILEERGEEGQGEDLNARERGGDARRRKRRRSLSQREGEQR